MEVLCAYVRTNAPASKARLFPGTVLDRLVEANPDITDDAIVVHPAIVAAMAGYDFTLATLRAARGICFFIWVYDLPPPREDLRTTLDIIGRRSARQRALEDERSFVLDLTRTSLQRVTLSEAHLERVELMEAHLEGARLDAVHLENAYLAMAHLELARLDRAHLELADLWSAHLEGASLGRAHLKGASVVGAHLEGAYLGGAHLEQTNLRGAQLSYVFIAGDRLAALSLESADLSAVTIHGGAARFVDFSSAMLDPETDLRNMFVDASVVLPQTPHPRNVPVYRWPEKLENKEFHARWRGWVEASPDPLRPAWSDIAPPGFKETPAIPPPEGVQWADTASD